MVITSITGGLGNQLFQYAAGRALSIEHNQPMYIDYSWYSIIVNETKRSFELKNFNLPINTNFIKSNLKSRTIRHGLSVISKAKNEDFYKIIKEDNPFKYKSSFFDKKSNYFVNGYWQSWKYIDKHIKIIDEIMVNKDILSKKDIELINYAKVTNSVSLHVRRGDYKNTVFDIINLKYYLDAIATIKKILDRPLTIFIFSDDIHWVRSNLSISHECIYVAHNDESKCTNDFEIMRNCKHSIIANSSFSWWAAFLGSVHSRNCSSYQKLVVAPDLWRYGLNYFDTDLYPKHWITIAAK